MTNKELDDALRDINFDPLSRIVEGNDYPDHCTCEETEHEYHLCPYSEEVDEEEKLCNCCPYCTEQCADGI